MGRSLREGRRARLRWSALLVVVRSAVVIVACQACLHVLEELAKVYHHDQISKDQKMTPTDRLKHHKLYSRPVMNDLKLWIEDQLDGKVEPNSGLGGALKYLKKHWKALTLFLKDGKAPPDNNICERAIKKAVLNRKNAMFSSEALRLRPNP